MPYAKNTIELVTCIDCEWRARPGRKSGEAPLWLPPDKNVRPIAKASSPLNTAYDVDMGDEKTMHPARPKIR